jgi:hypothetical protein
MFTDTVRVCHPVPPMTVSAAMVLHAQRSPGDLDRPDLGHAPAIPNGRPAR